MEGVTETEGEKDTVREGVGVVEITPAVHIPCPPGSVPLAVESPVRRNTLLPSREKRPTMHL